MSNLEEIQHNTKAKISIKQSITFRSKSSKNQNLQRKIQWVNSFTHYDLCTILRSSLASLLRLMARFYCMYPVIDSLCSYYYLDTSFQPFMVETQENQGNKISSEESQEHKYLSKPKANGNHLNKQIVKIIPMQL